jgi:lipoyl(octanoyl) transferase
VPHPSAIHIGDFSLNSGAHHMREDEERALHFLSEETKAKLGSSVAIVRFYSWSPAAISIGFHQREREFDLEKMTRDGIELVRRPTGGRAVFHIDELTYSIVMKATKSNAEHYADINAGLKSGLLALGIRCEFQKTATNFRERYATAESAPCFTASARYELEVKGKKLLGSAQRRYQTEHGEVLLQHGSLMLTNRHHTLVNYLSTTDEKTLARVRAELAAHTTSVEACLGYVPRYDELVSILSIEFMKIWKPL